MRIGAMPFRRNTERQRMNWSSACETAVSYTHLAEQLEYIGITLTAVERLKDYLSRGKHLESGLPFYEADLYPMTDIKEELAASVRNNQVQDYASKYLKDTREQIARTEEKMRTKAEAVLKANKDAVSEQFITSRLSLIHILLFIRDQDFTGGHLVPQFIIGQFITCFSGFKQSISEKSNTLAVFCYIVSSQHLIQIQAGIWLKACPAAELHSPPVQILSLIHI